MKNKIILSCVLAVTMCGCNDFLTENLQGDLNSQNVMTTEGQAQQVLNGVYNGVMYSTNLWKFGDVASDDAVKGGNPGDLADLGYIENFTAAADNGVLSQYWQNTYETISRANALIDGIAGKSFKSAADMTNEARLLRAFSYFQLVNIFGEVPLKTKAHLSDGDIMVPLSPVSAIYGQIEDDLRAATALPDEQPAASAGRATSGAAWGLLAKTQLFQGKWADALASIKNLKAQNKYKLDSYANLFALGNEKSPETVFAIRFLSNQVPMIGNSLNQWFAPQAENGYYFDNPTDDWLQSFTEKQANGEDDPRIDLSVGRAGHTWTNGEMFDASWSNTGYLVRKHNQPLAEVEKGRKGDGGLAYVYLRYADVLLMEAECQNELGHPDLAESPLNEVRTRAGLAGVTGKGQAEMRTIIRLERRHELAFEFHRFFDLMRYGQNEAVFALNKKEGISFKWVEPRFYYPIPQAERDANSAIN
ncbi:MAG: RagB/SusD family nutrient uptake outer membrane protein [Bacteroidaceae bacterium]|nr:RagB/SusD family nutrient uptake outer membrane protein [Bacteroidaceae bacterium]